MMDNKIRLITRLVAVMVVPFLWLAFVILYVYPDSTGERFAWAIEQHLTAMYMGAGYLGGSWLFINALIGRRWHRIQHGFLPIATFTWFMMVSTFLHWERFSHGKLGFTLWLILYVITPFLVPALWLFNRKADTGQPEDMDLTVPSAIRWILKMVALGLLTVVVIGFMNPGLVISIWPWILTALTARVMCGWGALLGVGSLALSGETRWSGWKVPLESIAIWHMLVLIAAALNPGDFKAGLVNWYTAAVAVMVAGVFVFYPVMELGSRKAK